MQLFLDILGWVLFSIAATGLVYWTLVLWRVRHTMRDRATIRAGLDLPVPEGPDGPPKVSIVVPMHNEQRVIDACAASLRRQDYPNLEIVFVLDRCTDDTAKLLAPHAAADDRIIIIENHEQPENWSGKCHAAHLGAMRATGDWLLFTDADTQFEPGLVRASVALAADRGFALLSLLSTLTYRKAFERVAQAVATMVLVRMYPLDRGRRERPRPFANGQFMLFRRDWYEKVGGHEHARDALLEDLRFARLIDHVGGEGGVFLADGMLTCSMYDSLRGFITGWKRIFIEATSRKVRRLRKCAWRLRLAGAGLPVAQVGCLGVAFAAGWFAEPWSGVAAAGVVLGGLLMQGLALGWIYRAGGAPLFSILFYPIGCWIVGGVLLEGARDLKQRRPVVWGGMQYTLEPR